MRGSPMPVMEKPSRGPVLVGDAAAVAAARHAVLVDEAGAQPVEVAWARWSRVGAMVATPARVFSLDRCARSSRRRRTPPLREHVAEQGSRAP